MCWRLFISTRTPLAPRDEPALALRPPGPDAEEVVAALGGFVVEAGAHTGCACGFFATFVARSTQTERRSEIAGMEEALTPNERAELEGSTRSMTALGSALRQALESGPVPIYACWYGEQGAPIAEPQEASLKEVEDALEPFPEGAVLVITAA